MVTFGMCLQLKVPRLQNQALVILILLKYYTYLLKKGMICEKWFAG